MAESHASRGESFAETAWLEDFLAVLRLEREELEGARTERLEELAERKRLCAERLEGNTQADTRRRIEDALRQQRQGRVVQDAAAEAFITLLSTANECNRVNGILIHQHLGQVRLSLARIESNGGAGRSLYRPNGQGDTPRHSRHFGAA